MPGKFIVLEGTDGAGKTSVITTLKEYCSNNNKDVTFVQDPGGTAIGQALRKVLLNPEFAEMTPLTELLLYSASRSQLVTEKIRPALESGKTVISDRFIYSTLAYQGAGTQLSSTTLSTVVNAGADNLQPDYVIFLDLPAELGLSRVNAAKDRVEGKGLTYMQQVRECYKNELAKLPEGNLITIDARPTQSEVQKKVLEYIDALL